MWFLITSLGTPGMSDGCHENTSTFARRKATSALSYLSSRVPLIVNVPSAPASPTGTFFIAVAAALDLLLLELSGKSLIRLQRTYNFLLFHVVMFVGERSRNSKFSTHHQDQSMEFTSNEREGVHLHTLVDRERKRSRERD